MGKCGLYLGQQELGALHWETDGGKMRLSASCPCEMGLIYRVVIQTDRGLHRLGVMLPEKDQFLLRRELPAGEEPRRAFIDRSLPGEEHLPGLPLAFSAFSPAWEEDGLLMACTSAGGELKSADWMDVRYFLFPLELGKRCVYAPFLCITTLLEWKDVQYGIFCKEEGRYLPLSDRLRWDGMGS